MPQRNNVDLITMNAKCTIIYVHIYIYACVRVCVHACACVCVCEPMCVQLIIVFVTGSISHSRAGSAEP